jgi:hypothetical protein
MAALIGCLVLGGIGLWLGRNDARTAFSYLTAFSFATSLAVGALLFLMLGYAINARWMSALRRLNEVIASALTPLALAFAGLAAFASQLYPWQHASAHLQAWLNLRMFCARGALYFALWLVPTWLLRRWSVARREAFVGGDELAALARERALSSALLFPGVVALTFAAFDWTMSLTPDWFSSAYGLYWLCGGGVGAVSLLIVLAFAAQRSGALPALTPHHFHALGRVLFALVILWAYIGYFQLFLITLADEPREVAFFIARGRGSWRWIGPALALGHFALPVLALAPKAIKLRAGALALVSGWLLLMHYLDAYYLVLPAHAPYDATPAWQDAAAFACIVGACGAFCAWLQRGVSPLALGDPLLASGLRYRSET